MFEWDDEDCGTVKDIGAIKRIANFTGSQFYVRKEILCVLENFNVYLQDKLNTDALTALDRTKLGYGDQFIITGSPGTGKSCIVALICFYLAIVKKVPAVWYRRDNGGNIKPVTRLFYEGVYYEWDS
ncbi:hypothetical protein GN244_ATG02288 [Phytophthora infestans]|uniref:Crinkler (CRN) family protein n=1 Tax=Phytophthora infestans TaxID=4787 RepID=A0A833WLN9_PHYIN|nr:hypothetical protein GN244_ATG02288 [Phytophthora infestans]KAF4148092.1 hypothetical protein GN958_ATG02718 [Phytophthora infestans]KAF4148194.1 hypothetical protein GN958_ATG02618 [Phytophthora infestans]